jgi:hypothetical protein
MYRVIDTPGLLSYLGDARFGSENCRLKVTVRDNFLTEQENNWTIHFNAGRARLAEGEPFDIELSLDISAWSSILMGTVGLDQLDMYGLVELSDAGAAERLARLFSVSRHPICMTGF